MRAAVIAQIGHDRTRGSRFAVDTFERGALEPRHMVTDTISLDATPAMLEKLHHGDGHHCKVMVACGCDAIQPPPGLSLATPSHRAPRISTGSTRTD